MLPPRHKLHGFLFHGEPEALPFRLFQVSLHMKTFRTDIGTCADMRKLKCLASMRMRVVWCMCCLFNMLPGLKTPRYACGGTGTSGRLTQSTWVTVTAEETRYHIKASVVC